jgi:hypothetical protein
MKDEVADESQGPLHQEDVKVSEPAITTTQQE